VSPSVYGLYITFILISHCKLQYGIEMYKVMKQYVQCLHNKYEILAWSTHTFIYLFNSLHMLVTSFLFLEVIKFFNLIIFGFCIYFCLINSLYYTKKIDILYNSAIHHQFPVFDIIYTIFCFLLSSSLK
jgi:hypothetical protein